MKSRNYSILQIGKFFYPEKGGIESTTKTIFDGFRKDGYRIDVLCFDKDKKTQTIKHDDGFVIKAGSFSYLASTPLSIKFFYWFKKIRNNYDIIHVHVPNPLACIALFLFSTKAKVVVHWHSDILTHKLLHLFLAFFEKQMLKRADLILGTTPIYIANSPHLKPFLHKTNYLCSSASEESFKVNPARVKQIKEQYNNRKIIFSLGRFIYYKGFEYLIEAAKDLPADFVVLLGGGGPMNETYDGLIVKNQLQNKVFIINEISQGDVGNYFSACSLFCLPSTRKTEAFGLVIVEAMIFSKPVVATNIAGSGTAWVNQHDITGLNVEPENSKELAEAIVTVVDGGRYEEFARNARRRYEQEFTNEKVILELQKFYLTLLEPKVKVVEQLSPKVNFTKAG